MQGPEEPEKEEESMVAEEEGFSVASAEREDEEANCSDEVK